MTAQQQSKSANIGRFLLIFAVVYLGSQLLLPMVFPDRFGKDKMPVGISMQPVDATVKGGHSPQLTVYNNTQSDVHFADRCPMPPVEVFRVDESGRLQQLQTEETALPCTTPGSLAPGTRAIIDLASWKYSLFGEYGTYEVRLSPKGPDGTELAGTDTLVARFDLYEAGMLTKLFRAVITKPFLNFLIFVASFLPDHNLGVGIIMLTLLVKLLLFFPTQHAMEGQRKLQKLQPKLDEIRKKFKDDPAQMNKEVMKLWKEHNVNPFQSCLPVLLQFPVLIGLFFVIRDGSVLETSRHLIYPFYQHLDWTSFGTHFLGLELKEPSMYIFPPLLFALQFIQLKLSFAAAKKKQVSEKKDPAGQQEMQQRIMLYGLPVMIAVFAFQFASGVALYWAISTLFAIGQQWVVNKRAG